MEDNNKQPIQANNLDNTITYKTKVFDKPSMLLYFKQSKLEIMDPNQSSSSSEVKTPTNQSIMINSSPPSIKEERKAAMEKKRANKMLANRDIATVKLNFN